MHLCYYTEILKAKHIWNSSVCMIERYETGIRRQVTHVEQELPTLPEHLILAPDLNGVRLSFCFQCSVWKIVVCSFVMRLLVIVLYVLL